MSLIQHLESSKISIDSEVLVYMHDQVRSMSLTTSSKFGDVAAILLLSTTSHY